MFRVSVEGLAARLAAERHTPGDIQDLEDLVHSMKSTLASQQFKELLDYDLEFHKRLVKTSSSKPVMKAFDAIALQIRVFMTQEKTIQPSSEDLAEIPSAHKMILEAIEKRKPHEAESLARQHIIRSAERLVPGHPDKTDRARQQYELKGFSNPQPKRRNLPPVCVHIQ